MHRLFVDPRNISKDQIVLAGELLHKVRTVLRMVSQDTITILDGRGREYFCRIVSITSRRAVLQVLRQRDALGEPAREIHLGQALPKSDKMGFVIQKAVELGVTAVHPFVSRRSVPRYDPKRHSRWRERWQRISLEAAQQSGRGLVPPVSEPVDFAAVLGMAFVKGLNLILHQDEKSRSLREVLGQARGNEPLLFLVGPEGGFDKEEIATARKHGFEVVNLGQRVLRTETAALTFLSIAEYEFGEIC